MMNEPKDLLNKHLIKIINDYISCPLTYKDELLTKTIQIRNDNIRWWVPTRNFLFIIN